MSYDLRDFERDVIERSRSVPVVVDFWASWCGPCKMLGPVIEKLAGESGGRWDLVKVDTEAVPGLGGRFNIRSIPTLALFSNGKEVARQAGAMGAADIVRWTLAQRR